MPAADPYRAYNFKLDIQGITQGHFTACSGPSVRVDVHAYREGGASQLVRQIPGKMHCEALTLRYGLSESLELWTWFQQCAQGRTERRSVSIIVLDADGATEKLRWNLFNAWPSAYRAAALDALTGEVAIEELELVFESLDHV